ncbi:hypothetical protein [Crateriforma conspicua]|uniref:Type II secretion system protein K n=1 Tax=Crateriforma conspicua TaxID=2527996 RepID=A0A5C6FRX6_9PLAN|nr:hypothetical protein [Crateriforma conspicua]TWU62891.1 hypothetical protein V7x_46280 [Crateriforma conspicua]
MKSHQSRDRRPAFVLLIVLVALITSSVILVQTANQTAMFQRMTIRLNEDVQQSWGQQSLERAILPASAGLFATNIARDDVDAGPMFADKSQRAIVADRIVLGGQRFDLLLSDEDAKANLNAVYDFAGERACQRLVQDMVQPMQYRWLALTPERRSLADRTAKDSQREESRINGFGDNSPTVPTVDFANMPPAFRSWGQVFDQSQIVQQQGSLRVLAELSQNLTIFGSGRLNVWSANEAAIVAVCRDVVQDGLARRLAERISDTSLRQVELVLNQTITNQQHRQTLRQRLADASQATSLWIEASGPSRRRQSLAVRRIDDAGIYQTRRFVYP